MIDTPTKAHSFMSPEQVLHQLSRLESKTVADLGTGSGAYALALARRVGTSGKVYAVDIQKELIGRLAKEAQDQGFKNLHVLWGAIDKAQGTTLASESCDSVVLSNVFFQIDAKDLCAKEVARILKHDGELLFVEWSDSFSHLGPHPDRVVKEHQVEKLFAMAGMSVKKRFNAGPHHYGIVFTKTV